MKLVTRIMITLIALFTIALSWLGYKNNEIKSVQVNKVFLR